MIRKCFHIIFIIILIVEGAWLLNNLHLPSGLQKALNLGYYCPAWDANGPASLLCYQIDKTEILNTHLILLYRIIGIFITTLVLYIIGIIISRRKKILPTHKVTR